MSLWALKDDPERGTPTTGKEAIRLRDKESEEHTYYSPEFLGVEVNIRAGCDTLMSKRRDHFTHPEGIERTGAERRVEAEIGRIGIEAVLRGSDHFYEVGRGNIVLDTDMRESATMRIRDPGFHVVYARERGGRAPKDYFVVVLDKAPHSDKYLSLLSACSSSGEKSGLAKYVETYDGRRVGPFGLGNKTGTTHGKVYVATVLIESRLKTGEGSFVRDFLMRTGLPINYYNLENGEMRIVAPDGSEQIADIDFTLSPRDVKKGSVRLGSRNVSNPSLTLAEIKPEYQATLKPSEAEGDQSFLF